MYLILGLWAGSGLLVLYIRWRTEGYFGIMFNNLKQGLTRYAEMPISKFSGENIPEHVRHLEQSEAILWAKASEAHRSPRLRDLYPWPMVLLMAVLLIFAHALYGPFTAPSLLDRKRLVRPTPH